MPASNIDSYLQDARNNFDAVRLAPICADANRPLGQCQNVHVSTNCYYGYQDVKNTERPGTNHVDTDCEMVDLGAVPNNRMLSKPMSKKRCADEQDYPQTKRLRDGKCILIHWKLIELLLMSKHGMT